MVAPDAGRVRVCERWTDRLGCPLAIIHKRRDPDVANQVRMFEVVGQVAGRTCILVDDMIDTGATIAKAAEALFEQGASQVIATATHGVLSGAAVDILKNSRISEIIITNTLPVPQEKRFDKLTVLSIAPLLGPGDQRGVQRRVRHQPVRRPDLIRGETAATAVATPRQRRGDASPPPPEARGRRPGLRFRAVLAHRPVPPSPAEARTASRRTHPARRAGVLGAADGAPVAVRRGLLAVGYGPRRRGDTIMLGQGVYVSLEP